MDLSLPVSALSGIGPAGSKKLAKLGIVTVLDLLTHLPFRYEDRSLISSVSAAQPGEQLTFKGEIISLKNQFTRHGKVVQKGTFADSTGTLDLLWFNQKYLPTSLPTGTPIALFGRVDRLGSKPSLTSPEYELIPSTGPLLHMGRLVGIYPETAGLSSKWFRQIIGRLLAQLTSDCGFPDPPPTLSEFPSWLSALRCVHQPESLGEVAPAKARLAFDELTFLQLLSQARKTAWQTTHSSRSFQLPADFISTFSTLLPFSLTPSQSQAIAEILSDLTQPMAMNRLLDGDVGSGKTVVAAAAAYLTHLNHLRTLILAPTQILAHQHHTTLTKLFQPLGLSIDLVTASAKPNSKNASSPVIVGTHALLHHPHLFDQVGLVVIDEQHRFGVAQRSLLAQLHPTPHLLTMTATPIPRTIALVQHGDLAISRLDQPPSGRLPVKTWLVPDVKRTAAYAWIRTQIQASACQAFVVCPFISPSESAATVKAATQEYDQLHHHLAPLRLGLLHGKLSATAKTQVIAAFNAGQIDVLVTTPVVEVGIDVPNAHIMIIEGADRFGLAQLHQLRGRVGRDSAQAYCLLFAASDSERLTALTQHHSGHELAEIDLRLRGPGQLYGTAQHGGGAFRIADYPDFVHLPLATQVAHHFWLHLDLFPVLKNLLKAAKIDLVQPN